MSGRLSTLLLLLALHLAAASAGADDAEPPAPSPAAAEMLKSMREKGILSADEYDDIYRRQALYEYEEREREKAPPWARDWTVGGDLRLRWERIDVGDLKLQRVIPPSQQGLEDDLVRGEDAIDFINNKAIGRRDRYRLRFRIGAERLLGENWTVGFRIATAMETSLSTDLGNDLVGSQFDLSKRVVDYRSTNVTLGDYFEPKGIYLDRAYLRFNPEIAPALQVYLGKFANPFLSREFYGDYLVWDHDIQPEGLALKYRFDFVPERWWIDANFGAFVIGEIGAIDITSADDQTAQPDLPDVDDRDPYVLAYQLGTSLRPFGWAQLGLRGSYYDYRNLSIRDAAILADLGNGGDAIEQNPLFSTLPEFSEYFQRPRAAGRITQGVVDAYVRVTPFGEKWPVLAFAQYSTLLSASTEPDGWGFGIEIGTPEIVRVRAMWARLERNSTVALFTDSDLFDGYTNAKGWQISIARQLSEHITLELTYRSSQVAERECFAITEQGRPAVFCDAATAQNLNGDAFDFRESYIQHRKRIQVDLIAEF